MRGVRLASFFIDGFVREDMAEKLMQFFYSLKESDITSDMTMMDWVRNERFIELWGEGHRFYDVRRWMIAPQVLRAGAREGLNVLGAGMNPSASDLNQRTVVNQQFQWSNRMYLWPIKSDEIYNNPQLVQAPEY